MAQWDAKRTTSGQFGPGNSGRPRGARNRVGRKQRQIYAASMDLNLAETLEAVRQEDPKTYLRLMLRACPTPQFDEEDPREQLTTEQIDRRLHELAARLVADGYGSGAGPGPAAALSAPALPPEPGRSGDGGAAGEAAPGGPGEPG